MGDSALIGSGGTRSGTGDGSSAESAAFVLCIEGNETRDQALLLIESIRAFGGGLAASEILAVAPRQGLGVDADTRARLEALGASYHEEPLNRVCPEYGSANRVYAAAWAAEVCDAEVLFVLDSDTLVLGEPEPLGTACDLAVRPVDVKGSTTTGAGDPFDGYWRSLCELASASIDALPFVATVFDGLRVRASYNGGYSVVRRSSGILQRTAELFTRSVAADLRPHEGHSGHRLFASTGYVSDRANEYWGSVQAALSIAAWSTTRRVRLLGRRYNVPLHMLADAAHWTEDWRDLHPLHVHYHWMLRAADRARGLRTLAMIGVPWDQLQWLAARAGRPEGRRAAVPARATQRCRQVVICGMHRTGTSLVASVLRQAGIDIGRELNPGGRGNLRGHFEDEAVHRLHEEMLAAAGYTCLTAGGDLSREVRSGFEERARTFIANRADRPLWGWKDPRTCLFFEFWDRLLPAAGYVMLYRHPLDVALSLWRRGTEPELRLDPWLAIHAYEVYNRLLLDFRRRHPERCVLAQVPALTADLSGFVALAADKLDLALGKDGAADLFFAGELAPESSDESLVRESCLAGVLEIYLQLEAAADLPGRQVRSAVSERRDGERGRNENLSSFLLASSLQSRAVRERRDEIARVLSQIESSRSFTLVRGWWWLLRQFRRVFSGSRRERPPAPAERPLSARPEARRDTATGQRAATSLAPPAG